MADTGGAAFELHDDTRHQRLEWRLERVGWALIALLLVAASLGLLGYGPLSHERLRSADGSTSLAYERFQRANALSRYEIEISGLPEGSDRMRLHVDRNLVDALAIEAIEPQPESVTAGADVTTYEFQAGSGAGPRRVVVHYRPSSFGRLRGRIAAEGGAPIVVDQFVYP